MNKKPRQLASVGAEKTLTYFRPEARLPDKIRIYDRFSMIEHKRPDMRKTKPGFAIGNHRGAVGEYNSASKRNLKRAIHSINASLIPRRIAGTKRFFKPATFMTLTYPRVFESDPFVCKLQLKSFWKRIQYRFPAAFAIWCIEMQKRGAWHFHLIVCWPPPKRGEWRKRQLWISKCWAQVVAGSGNAVDNDHLLAGTRLDALITDAKLVEYISKPGSKSLDVGSIVAGELSKHGPQKSATGSGRWWGVLNRGQFEKCRSVVDVFLSAKEGLVGFWFIRNFWAGKYAERGLPEPDYFPRYVTGQAAKDFFKRCDFDGLSERDQIDVFSGEVVCVLSDEAELSFFSNSA